MWCIHAILFIPFMCMPALLSSPPQHWTPTTEYLSRISFSHSIRKFCSRVHYLRCCHTFLIKLCYQSEWVMSLTSYSIQPQDWSINNTDPSKGLWHVQPFYKEKVERKSKTRAMYILQVFWPKICAYLCVFVCQCLRETSKLFTALPMFNWYCVDKPSAYLLYVGIYHQYWP